MKAIKIFIVLMILPLLSIAQQGTIQFNPSEVNVVEGETFEVEVVFNTAGSSISVFDLHMLFNPEFLEVVAIETLQGDLFSYIEFPIFDNQGGKIDMAAYQIGKSIPTSDFAVVQITLQAMAPVELTEVTHPTGVFPETLLAFAGVNMLDEASPLKVTIQGNVLSDEFEDGSSDFHLNIWPNPTSDFATIGFKLKDSDRVNLSIYDIHGKLIEEIFEGNTAANQDLQFEVDLKHLANGNYACRLTSGKKYQTKMLVLAK